MKATITFTREIDEMPRSCNLCPFVDTCDTTLHGITKRGGMEFTVAATKRRHKACPLVIEGDES